MNNKTYLRFGLTALAVLACLGVQPCAGQTDDPSPAARPEKRPSRHDPIAAAFAIPYGTALSDVQRSEYERLKDDKEADLRQAFDDQAAAATPGQKVDASREIAALRHDIRAGIRQILAMPNKDASPPQSPGEQGYSQQAYGPQGPGSSGQAAYYGSYNGPEQAYYGSGYYNPLFAYGYYGPVYGYPVYGVWYPANYWSHHHHYGEGYKVVNQRAGYAVGQKAGLKVALKTVGPVSVPVKPIVAARPVAPVRVAVKPNPVAKPAARPALAVAQAAPPKLGSNPARHR